MPDFKIGIIIGHPTQFEGPFYQYFEKKYPGALEVIFVNRERMKDVYDPELEMNINWGIDLLSGYRYTVLPETWKLWLWKKIRQADYNLLIVNGYSKKVYLLSLLYGWLLRIPVALRIDTVEFRPQPASKYILKKILYFILNKICSRFFVTGSLSESFIKKMEIETSKISFFPYAVDNDFFKERSILTVEEKNNLRKSLGITEKDKVILAVSKLNEREAPWDLLKAFVMIVAKDLHLLIIGYGILRNGMENFAGKHPDKKITFAGYVNYPELPKYYGISDLFVHCPKNEPWGVSVQEAMASGLPVVASEFVGSSVDLIKEGQNGFIYKSKNIQELKEKLLNTLSLNKLEVKRINDIILKNWSYESTLKTLLKISNK